MIEGFYSPDVRRIPFVGDTEQVLVTDPGPNFPTAAVHRGPVLIIAADISNAGDKNAVTMEITRGTWNGTDFTPAASNASVAYVASQEGMTLTIPIFYMLGGRISTDPYVAYALRVDLSGDNPQGHLMTQGMIDRAQKLYHIILSTSSTAVATLTPVEVP